MNARLLEILVEIIHDLPEQVIACITAIDTMIAVGIDVHLEVLICLHQCLGIFEGVLRMHIIVGQSMTDQQGAMQPAREMTLLARLKLMSLSLKWEGSFILSSAALVRQMR